MTGAVVALTAAGKVRPITVDVNWGISSGVSTTRTSSTRTLTVPAGNPGVIRFSLSGSSGDFYYQKNGGSFTLFIHNSTLSVANGDTLALRFVGTSPSTGEITVYDNSLGASVGDFIGDIL